MDAETIERFRKAEWASYAGCEGYQMGAPPMHHHPTCPLCGGHEPAFNAKYSNCFRTAEEAKQIGITGGITVGHKPTCVWALAPVEAAPEEVIPCAMCHGTRLTSIGEPCPDCPDVSPFGPAVPDEAAPEE